MSAHPYPAQSLSAAAPGASAPSACASALASMPASSAPASARPADAGGQRALRDTLGAFATGVTVVTALGTDGRPLGVTVNSFASVSLDPPLVLWSQSKAAPSHAEFLQASTMVINVLSQQQQALSQHFARAQSDKFAGVDHGHAACGTPILAGCAATLVCSVVDRYYGGDHTIHLCRIESFEDLRRPPLVFCRGAYVAL